MWHKIKLLLANPAKSLWIHPTLGAVFAIVFSLLAKAGTYFISPNSVPNIEVGTLDDLLNIIASSMLAVTTFSLSIMVSALASSSSSATPRARLLIMADDTARIAIASFISAFIYSVIAKVALSLGYYGVVGQFILFISTILVLVYIILTLIRWVHTLSQLGSLGDAVSKIEHVAKESLATWRFEPNLGATHAQPHPNAQPILNVLAERTGYLFDLDLASLQHTAKTYDVHIHIIERTGKFLSPNAVILQVYANKLKNDHHQALLAHLKSAITLGKSRSYHQDPRFGLLVMSEVGQRAMSASINDPATAITVLNSLTHLIVDTKPSEHLTKQNFDRLSIINLSCEDLVESVFAPIARDSVRNLEVNQRLLKCLAIIYQHAPEPLLQQDAFNQAQELISRCEHHFEFEKDRVRLKQTFNDSFAK